MGFMRKTRFFTATLVILITTIFSAESSHSQQDDKSQIEKTEIASEIVLTDLEGATDFSVSQGGDSIFIADLAGKRIRRVQGESDEIVVNKIEDRGQEAKAISVFAIDTNRVIVGVSGFPSPKSAVSLFDLSASEELPLDFTDGRTTELRNFQRAIKRADSFDVVKLFEQQRGITMVRRFRKDRIDLCDILLKDGALGQLADDKYDATFGESVDVASLTVDPLGGYLVSMTSFAEGNSLVYSDAGGTMIQSFPLDLNHVVSMGFTPHNRRLYALVAAPDSNGNDAKQEGIYEILSDGEGCSVQMVLALERPKLMKIDAQGTAWVM